MIKFLQKTGTMLFIALAVVMAAQPLAVFAAEAATETDPFAAEAATEGNVGTAVNSPTGYDLKAGTLFNTPVTAGGSTAQQFMLRDVFKRAVDATPSGEIISISMYSIDINTVADRLIAAHKRGVQVRFLVWNERANTQEVTNLKAELGTNPNAQSHLIVCTGSCRLSGTGGIQHAKGATISRIIAKNGSSIPYVSFIGSANFSVTNSSNSWNNTEVITNNKAVYDSLKGYIYGMRVDRTLYNYPTLSTTKYAIYYYPTTKGTDPVLNALNKTHCAAPAGFGTNGKTVVRVAMFEWSSGRAEIANRLITLKNAGCDVAVIYNSRNAGSTTPPAIAVKLFNAGVPLWDGRADLNHNGSADVYQHAKTTIINGNVDNKGRTLVFAGSGNFTTNAITDNTEIVLRISDKAETIRHQQVWSTWKSKARHITRKADIVFGSPSPAATADEPTTDDSGAQSELQQDDGSISNGEL